jgi:hypothetical protein
MINALILLGVVLTGALLAWPRLANAPLWRATITPLASIIGSGFLVLGPILDFSYGAYAPLVMLALCLTAYLFGWAIRFNIERIDTTAERAPLAQRAERVASGILAFAYVISVTYYLNLFGAFGVSLTALNDTQSAKLLTTAVFLVILAVGWLRGFSALERVEQISVGLKLSIIMGLLVGLSIHFAQTARDGALLIHSPVVSGWQAVMLAAGLIVTVQGFETSRYLGDTYDAATRVRSMKLAQWISAAIYMTYIGLLAYAFDTKVLSLDETSIIDLMDVVAPILPVLLVAAALSAQFSAAVADTGGSGGLIGELSGGKIPPKLAYVIIVGFGLFLTWTANIFEIISYASRAFAAYYAIQAGIAAVSAHASDKPFKATVFGLIALAGVLATVFGTPVEQ